MRRWDQARRRVWGGRTLPVWHHGSYRLPIPDLHESTGMEPRRADLALWALLGAHNRHQLEMHEATRAPFAAMSRVHTPAYLESLTGPTALAQVFGTEPGHLPVDAMLDAIRLAVGGTIDAARHARAQGGPTLNLLGGFHHASPDRGHGFCAVNDVAVAVATLRAEGFAGQIVVLDLDAHPPDGTAACLLGDERVWIGSISGSDWGAVDGADETLLPDADDATYLRALDALLGRAPTPALAFVIAGGDVLAGDRLGRLRMTVAGVERRDQRVADWLGDVGSVWLPGGGYQGDAWRLLANTAVVLIGPSGRRVSSRVDPVRKHFGWVSRGLHPADLTGETQDGLLTAEDVDAMFGGRHGPLRLLGYYSAQGIELALDAYGILPHLRRLGYARFQVELERGGAGDRARLTGEARGERHLLWELVLSVELLASERVLALQWMTLRHPLGTFQADRAPLPGQDAPGLGLGQEALTLVEQIAERLRLAGVLYRPAWLHTALFARHHFRFLDATAQGEFDALVRDVRDVPLSLASRMVASGSVWRNGVAWTWPAAPMIAWRDGRKEPDTHAELREDAFESSHFSLSPPAEMP